MASSLLTFFNFLCAAIAMDLISLDWSEAHGHRRHGVGGQHDSLCRHTDHEAWEVISLHGVFLIRISFLGKVESKNPAIQSALCKNSIPNTIPSKIDATRGKKQKFIPQLKKRNPESGNLFFGI